jgi:hypothetical protein
MGLLFEIADCELQPVPPRYKLAASRTLGVKNQCKCVDLVLLSAVGGRVLHAEVDEAEGYGVLVGCDESSFVEEVQELLVKGERISAIRETSVQRHDSLLHR